ncbi:unnamed protein product, partial [Allacma fusca]
AAVRWGMDSLSKNSMSFSPRNLRGLFRNTECNHTGISEAPVNEYPKCSKLKSANKFEPTELDILRADYPSCNSK